MKWDIFDRFNKRKLVILDILISCHFLTVPDTEALIVRRLDIVI